MAHSNRSKNNPKAGREPRQTEIVAAREAAGHSQEEAAETIYTSPRTLQGWEQAQQGRSMPASAYELYMLKTGQFLFHDLQAESDDAERVKLRVKLITGAIVSLDLPVATLASLSRGLTPKI